MTGKRKRQAPAIAEPVGHDAYEHDGGRERPQANAEDLPFLRLREPELPRPVTDHLASHGEDRGRGGDRRKTGPKQRATIEGR